MTSITETPFSKLVGSLHLWSGTNFKKYGKGKNADNICVYCGRGGARSFGGAGRAHKACIPANDVREVKP